MFLLTRWMFLWQFRCSRLLLCPQTQPLFTFFPHSLTLGSSEDAHRLGLLQLRAELAPHQRSFCLSKMTFKYYLRNQYSPQLCCISKLLSVQCNGCCVCRSISEVSVSGAPLPAKAHLQGGLRDAPHVGLVHFLCFEWMLLESWVLR